MNFALYGAGPLAGLALISLTLAAAFAYVGGQDRRVRGLGFVAAAYAFNAARYFWLALGPFDGDGPTRITSDLANVASSALLIAGALQMAGVRMRALHVAGASLLLCAAYAALERPGALIATSVLGSAAQLVFAWALYRLARDSQLSGYCIAAALAAALALLRLFLPLLVVQEMLALAVLLAGVLYVGTAVALIVALQHAQRAEIGSARREAFEAQRFARVLFSNTTDLMAVLRVEPAGRFTIQHANSSLLAALRASHPDRSIDARPGRDLEDSLVAELALPDDSARRILECFREAVRTGAPKPIRGAFGLREQDAILTPIADADGRVTRIFYRGTDVTEARAAQEELRRSQRRFEAILERAPVAVAITRQDDGKFVYVNPAYGELAGAASEALIGFSAIDLGLWTEEDRKTLILDRQDADGAVQVECAVDNLKGRRINVILSVQALEFDGERCLLTMAQDVTEAVEGRRRAAEISERFTRIFNTSPVPLIVTRLEDGRYLEVNDAWLTFYGLKREQVLGRRTTELGSWSVPEDRRRFVEILERDGVVRAFPNRIRRDSEQPRDVLLYARTLSWDGERAVAGFEVDITAAKRAKEEIERLNASLERRVRERTAELEQALSEMEGFTYTVSHDLRTPLRAMTSFSDLLARRKAVAEDVQASAYAGRVSRAATKMGRMVDALLRYARLARQPLDPRAVALREEARALADELTAQHPERCIDWALGDLREVRADPALLRLALRGLMENAVKFTATREDARIEVSATATADEVRVAVKDNGVGFDMAFAGKLFAPFQRLHDETEFEGIGIGLAYARRVVERHGGRLWCEAAPDRGATFVFSLPG